MMNSMQSIEEQLQSLLLFFKEEHSWNSWEDLYWHMADFLEEFAGAYDLAICSLPLRAKDAQGPRVLWTRNREERAKLGEVYADFQKSSKELNTLELGSYKNQRIWLVYRSEEVSLFPEVLALFKSFVCKGFEQIQRYNSLLEMNSLIYIDDVTGLYNQRKLFHDLDTFISKSVSKAQSFTILFADADHFKDVNDKYGHLAGTKILRQFAHVFKETFRESDLIYRYGGDEFVILIPNISYSQAEELGKRLLEKVKEGPFLVDDIGAIPLTISVGIAQFPADARTKKEILTMADQMMYNAKKAGRGQVCSAKAFLKNDLD